MLQKAWLIENGKRILVKGIYQPSREEPINEWLASNICKRLEFEYCKYTLDIINGKLVSKCENFIRSNEEIISAYDVFFTSKKQNHVSDFEHYIQILEENKVPQARQNVENMFILDYLIMNIDRHMKNFGVIRNVETLKWVRTTPIFDNGESMQCDKLTNEMNFEKGKGKFFSDTSKDYEDMLKSIKDRKRLDLSKLDGLVQEYQEVLGKYQPYTDMTQERINKLCKGLDLRICKMKKNCRNE